MLEPALTELYREAITWFVERTLERIRGADPIDAGTIALLLRRYMETGEADLGEAAGLALARALDPAERAASDRDAEWLRAFAAAAAVSDDARVQDEAKALAETIRRSWGGEDRVDELALSVDACLAAADGVDSPGAAQDAIDQLERIVSAAYRPGAGMTRCGALDVRGSLVDQVRTASALLTAYQLTARLPYAMLAEELMQFAKRYLWSESAAAFNDDTTSGAAETPFRLNCDAARVLLRLAALHDAQEYREAAVIAPDADYRADAARILIGLAPRYRDAGAAAAIYALALGELQSAAKRE